MEESCATLSCGLVCRLYRMTRKRGIRLFRFQCHEPYTIPQSVVRTTTTTSSLKILQTPCSFSVSNVVSSGLKRNHAFSEETVKKKKQSVIKTSAYIFLGYATKKKSRGRSSSSLLSTQVPTTRRFSTKIESGGQSRHESKHFVVKRPIPHICHGRADGVRVKNFLAGVNFYRFNAKNWQFTV